MSLYRAPASATSGGTSSWKFWESKPAAAPQPVAPRQVLAQPALPSAQISPLRNPIQYFSAAMSETPIGVAIRDDQPTNRVAPAARPMPPRDQISLDVPTGTPTPQLYISLAQMSERQGNVPQARQQFQRALSMWPNDVEVLRATARMEDRQGQLTIAESLYRRAAAADPQHAGALNDLGLCLARQGQLEQSAQTIEQAIHLQPDKALYRNNAATVLIELQRDQMALAHLSAVHGPAASNYNMGKLLVQRNRPADALAYFQAAQRIEPTMQEAALAIARLGGTPVEAAQIAAGQTTSPPSAETSAFGPQLAPQHPATQPNYPATARGPALNASSQVPTPGYYPRPAATITPAAPAYRSATAPRYLPPVHPMTPGGLVR
jgi:tetratricopeptide (TPR) repeat protein